VRQLDIAGVRKTACREHGGDLWGEVFALVREVSGQEPKNEQGRGIDPQNPNIELAGSISLGCVKWLTNSIVVTYRVRYMPSLERWVVENLKTSEAGRLTPKIQISRSLARYRWGGVKRLAESMVVTYAVRYMPLLERSVVENPKMSEAGGLTPKI